MADRLPSLDLLLDLVQRERDSLWRHFESLDQKAGLVLAGAGVFVTLSGDAEGPLLWGGLTLGVSSALLPLAAFWPRDLASIRGEDLRAWVRAEEPLTRLMLLDTLVAEEPNARSLLDQKSTRLKLAMTSLALASLLTSAGTAL